MIEEAQRIEVDHPEELVETRLVAWYFIAALVYRSCRCWAVC